MKRQSRKSAGLWVSGINPVVEALRGEGWKIHELILARQDQRVEEIVERAGSRGVPIRHESRSGITALLGQAHHQGVALHVEEYPYTPIEAALERSARDREPLVALDSIQDPQNFGSILRSSCFLGAKGVVVPRDRSVRVTEAVMKVAAGATAYVPVIEVTNLVRAMDQLKEVGLWIVGLDAEGDRSIHETDLKVPLVLVVGSEHKGLRHLVRSRCDLLARIPAHGPLQSLNAATACAIALAEVQRQRSSG